MGMLFISHSSADMEHAERLMALLRGKGYNSVFLDIDRVDGINAGELWQETLYRKLRSCVALVAIVTDNWLSSHWCFAEVALARMQGKLLFGISASPLAAGAKMPALVSDHQFVEGVADFDGAVEQLVRGLEEAGLRSIESRAWDRARSPYPGLDPFNEKDVGVFFGRDEEIDRGLEILRGSVRGIASRMTFLLGASGSGKSSLLGAGILPRLRREEGLLLVGPFRPGEEPLDELASQTALGLGDVTRGTTLADELLRDGASLGKITRRLLRESGDGSRPMLFMVDQFEELLGRPQGHDSHAFLGLMRDAVTESGGRVSFVATLRSDHLGALQAHPATRGLGWQTLFVGPLDERNLREVIEEPARLAELRLEEGLVECMIADTPSPHALPLLAVTLQRLWEQYGKDGLLQVEEYEQLGGVRGSVSQKAESVLAGVGDEAQLDALRAALLMLVRIDENGNLVRQPARWGDTPEASRPLLDRLVTSRLLVRDKDDVQVTHEALFTAWKRLKDWIDEDRPVLVVKQRVSQATREWDEEGSEGDLWRGPRLDRALDLWEAGRLTLNDKECDFLRASMSAREAATEDKAQRDRERERQRRVALGRGLAYKALGEAESRPQRGLLLAAEAATITLDAGLKATAAAESALRELMTRYGSERLGYFGSRIRCMSFGQEGQIAVGCDDGTVGLVETLLPECQTTQKSWRAGDAALEDVTLEGDVLFTRAADGSLRSWELLRDDPGESFVEYSPAAAETTKTVWAISPSAFMSKGGGIVAIAREGEPLLLHTVASGEKVSLPSDGGATRALSFSPYKRWLADGREDGHVMLWDMLTVKTEPFFHKFQAHKGQVSKLVWAGDCFVTSGKDNCVGRWSFDEATGEVKLTELPSILSPVVDLSVSYGGNIVGARTLDGEAFCWMEDQWKHDVFANPVKLNGHSSSVGSVAVSSEFIVTSSSRDNYALLWETRGLRDGAQPLALKGEDQWLNVVAFAEGRTVVAGTSDGAVRRWEGVGVSRRQRIAFRRWERVAVRPWERLVEEPLEMLIPDIDLNNYVLSSDGSRLVSAGAKVSAGGPMGLRARIVHLKEGRFEMIEDPPTAAAVAMTPDGRLIVVGANDGTVSVRDLSTGTERRLSFGMQAGPSRLAVDPSGRWLLVEPGDGPLLVDLQSDAPAVRLEAHQSRLDCAAFDERGERLLAADAQGVVALWRQRDDRYELVRSLPHEGVSWCTFRRGAAGWVSGSGGWLLVASADDNAAPLKLEFGFKDSNPKFALSGRADRMVVAAAKRILSWDFAAEAPAETRIELPRHESNVMAVAVSGDGGRIATSMIDGPVRLWDPEDPSNPVALPRELQGDAVLDAVLLAFTDSDRRLITVDQHGLLAVWDLDVHNLVARARHVAGRELTPEERARFLSL